MIDDEGFRANVGIIIFNDAGRLFWGRRVGMNAWQFPQGGIKREESPEQAMFRELQEETGLDPAHVDVIGSTAGWLRYRLPRRFIRRNSQPVCIGQKQMWFALRLVGEESAFNLGAGDTPEFDAWRWVHYWRPVRDVVSFKRTVYRRALEELEPLIRVPAEPSAVEPVAVQRRP
jgi:putative (di)nucleoside polyphosphate hydrolase